MKINQFTPQFRYIAKMFGTLASVARKAVTIPLPDIGNSSMRSIDDIRDYARYYLLAGAYLRHPLLLTNGQEKFLRERHIIIGNNIKIHLLVDFMKEANNRVDFAEATGTRYFTSPEEAIKNILIRSIGEESYFVFLKPQPGERDFQHPKMFATRSTQAAWY